MPFTHIEKCDMLESYILCRKNSTVAQEHYHNLFPERDVPNRRYFLKIYRKFRTNQAAFHKKKDTNEFIVDEETEINILAYFNVNRTSSIRGMCQETGLSVSTIQRVLKKHKIHPYKFIPVHTLEEGDAARRQVFCNWFLQRCGEDRQFYKKILWSDESSFSNRGMFNRKNNHYWSHENLFRNFPRNPQRRFSVNVWCGIIERKIVGPVFFHGNLTGARYLQMMQNVIEEFLDDCNLEDRPQIFLQQDGAPAHNYRLVTDWLNETFNDRWIGTGGPVLWPPRSPDLTPLDFFFVGLSQR